MSSGRRFRIGWIIGSAAIAAALSVGLLAATVRAAYLVDVIPGADAGLATTPALEQAWTIMDGLAVLLILVAAVGVLVPVASYRRSRRRL